MINVLKRLAELDSANPRVEKTMTQEQSLTTLSNIEGTSQVNECFPMGTMAPHAPATLSMTASSGQELSGMLRDIMSLAGVSSQPSHQEIELSAPHVVTFDHGGDLSHDMGKAISIIDSMNTPDEDAMEGQEDRIYDNSPDEEIEAHDYGDKQVKPKPKEPLKKNGGGNPYEPTQKSLSRIEAELHNAWKKYVSESKPSAGLSKKKKSETAKKARAGKDIGKKGKGFKDVAAKAAKTYGSKEKGQKVAAAAMWKNIKR